VEQPHHLLCNCMHVLVLCTEHIFCSTS